MRATLRLGLVFLACAGLGLLSGCPGKQPRVKVHGKVTIKGQSPHASKRKPGNVPTIMLGEQLQQMDGVSLEKSERLSVVYYLVTQTGETDKNAEFYWASVNLDGDYEVLGKEGDGIPPGKYNVVVNSQLYQQSHDRFEGVFDPKKPPLIVDVGPDAGQPIIIDVGTRTLTRK